MINFLTEYWYLIIIAIVILIVAIYSVKVFFQMPKDEQISKVQEWLLYAVAQAERELGSGTGQLKLRYVYDNFIHRFPAIAAAISFEAFSLMVDKSLQKFNTLLNANKKLQNYVNNVKE